MWFKLSLLLLLFACCFNLASTRHTKNLRKSLNQKLGDHAVMDHSPYPVDAFPEDDGYDPEYNNVGSNDDRHPIDVVDEHNGYGDGRYDRNEIQDKRKVHQDHGLMEDSSSNDGANKINEILGKQLEDILAMFQKNENLNGKNEIPAKKKQSFEHGSKVSHLSSADDNHGKQKHGRFRREYPVSYGNKHSDGEAFVGGVLFWLIICFSIFLCCCLPGIIICVVLSRR